MNKFTNGVAPLRAAPGPKAVKLMDVPEKTVLDALGPVLDGYEQVFYRTARLNIVGWIYAGWLEEYRETLPKDCVVIPDPTPDPNDAQQYSMFGGYKQTNLCGEICAAYILRVPLADVLEKWKQEKPGVWQSVFSRGKARGTSWPELQTIFHSFEWAAVSLTIMMTDKVITRPRYTVSRLRDLLNDGLVIAGVNINNSGRLVPSGIPHWVVVTAVKPERAGYGSVEIYNPFPNRIEIYSWNEFVSSAKVPFGALAWKV